MCVRLCVFVCVGSSVVPMQQFRACEGSAAISEKAERRKWRLSEGGGDGDRKPNREGFNNC